MHPAVCEIFLTLYIMLMLASYVQLVWLAVLLSSDTRPTKSEGSGDSSIIDLC